MQSNISRDQINRFTEGFYDVGDYDIYDMFPSLRFTTIQQEMEHNKYIEVKNTIPKPSSENKSSRKKTKSAPKSSSENKSSRIPCKWSKKSVEIFFSFLKDHKYELYQLEKTRSSEIKKKLWMEASDFMLERHGLEYSAEQCSIKWKNIKVQIEEGEIEFRYRPDIEEIDPNSINKTIPEEINGYSKRKRKSEFLNEPVKQFEFIEYENEQRKQKRRVLPIFNVIPKP